MQIILNKAQFRDQIIQGTYPLLKDIQDSVKPDFDFMTRIAYNGLKARVFFNRKDYNLIDDGKPVLTAKTGGSGVSSYTAAARPKGKPGRKPKNHDYNMDLVAAPPPPGAPVAPTAAKSTAPVGSPVVAVEEFAPVEEQPETYEQMKERIGMRFAAMETLTESVIAGTIRALILSGAPGIGKTYSLQKALEKAVQDGHLKAVNEVRGRVSAIGLYAELYKNRAKGEVTILDDADGIFADDVALNVLKAALDSGDVRTLKWTTATPWLGDNSIPNVFDYEGTVVFVSNLDFDRLIARNSNIAEHLKALISRSIYLSLGVHTIAEVMTRVEYVARETPLLEQHNINPEQREEILAWLWANYENLREVSIRTLLKLATFMNTAGANWKHIASVTQLRVQKPV